MPKFVTPRDVGFFEGINLELLDDIVETPVIIYSLIPEKQNENIYGESVEKIYEPGILVNALIQHDDERTEDDEFGPNIQQGIICSFYRNTLKEKNFYPEQGDIIKYWNAYYEIGQVVDNQLLAGRAADEKIREHLIALPHSIIVNAHMVNKSSINVRNEP